MKVIGLFEILDAIQRTCKNTENLLEKMFFFAPIKIDPTTGLPLQIYDDTGALKLDPATGAPFLNFPEFFARIFPHTFWKFPDLLIFSFFH